LELTRQFTDHHRFTEREVTGFLKRCGNRALDAVITTEKDYVRLPRLSAPEVPIYFLRVEIEILSGGESWQSCVDRICKRQPMMARRSFLRRVPESCTRGNRSTKPCDGGDHRRTHRCKSALLRVANENLDRWLARCAPNSRAVLLEWKSIIESDWMRRLKFFAERVSETSDCGNRAHCRRGIHHSRRTDGFNPQVRAAEIPMKRADLEHIIRAAAANADTDEIVVIGSQAILGTFSDPPKRGL